MTLKQKFRKAFGSPRITDYGCELIEQIAEDFAIEFAEWLIENKILSSKMPTKELLEIYKKEKSL
jgi:hypothetical protein